MTQIAEYYRYMEGYIEQKLHSMTTDTMQEIKNKLKRKQNK